MPPAFLLGTNAGATSGMREPWCISNSDATPTPGACGSSLPAAAGKLSSPSSKRPWRPCRAACARAQQNLSSRVQII
eukprot:352807-Chlamydomonas_euryale.AAC.6